MKVIFIETSCIGTALVARGKATLSKDKERTVMSGSNFVDFFLSGWLKISCLSFFWGFFIFAMQITHSYLSLAKEGAESQIQGRIEIRTT